MSQSLVSQHIHNPWLSPSLYSTHFVLYDSRLLTDAKSFRNRGKHLRTFLLFSSCSLSSPSRFFAISASTYLPCRSQLRLCSWDEHMFTSLHTCDQSRRHIVRIAPAFSRTRVIAPGTLLQHRYLHDESCRLGTSYQSEFAFMSPHHD